ncbi:MAG: PAS domain S-box protein [Rhodoplanes sp.]|uniref:chemotaxis protein CheB n=1 Tax=Rhodoplanes sp. TaxID=1968906 RepID=UPI00184B7552|nr:chemotaxis protein CheB [Rhodoplanes sp.]NVO14150.1 PAS domain S-box protein [Rhodoplanes sp.]
MPRKDDPAPARGGRSAKPKPATRADSPADASADAPATRQKPPATRIVAIGASAGGLEALELFFDAMRADSGVAFVIVQHLSPDFRSVMDELLARRTRMSIRAVTTGTAVEPNVIYLRPAQQTLIIQQGVFVLKQEDKKTHLNFPIDAFLKSLARDQKDRAIAVILSGTGTDGTLGAAAIRDAGGIVLAQDPTTARFDSMPRSLIERNLASASAPPNALPRLLLRVLSGEAPPFAEEASEHSWSVDPERQIIQLLQRRCGADFGYYKKSTVGRRIRRRAEMAHLDDLAAYVEKLKQEPEEIDLLSKDLLIGVTSFFRDADAFSALSEKALPKIMAAMSPRRPVRVWVPGCATGEEAYSIAILLKEYARKERMELNAKVFATDIFGPALERAGRGVYDDSIVKALGPDLVERYFDANGSQYQVKPGLRRFVVFSPHNLLKDPPFTRMDLVSCRNLLIYFDDIAQRMVLMLFHFALDRNGILFLGPSEAISELADEFGVIDQQWRIFRKLRDVRLRESFRLLPSPSLRDDPALHHEPRSPVIAVAAAKARSAPAQRGLTKAYDAILDRFAPAGVLVSRDGTIFHVFGDAHRYLSVREGRFSNLITGVAIEDLRHTIGAGLERMRGYNTVPFVRQVRCRLAGEDEKAFKVTVERLNGSDWQDEDYCMVTFAEVAPPKKVGRRARAVEAEIESVEAVELYRERIRDLENELRATEENLQATIEEMETTNEELQATNEELMSTNEELQSTNEELNSVNEELLTVSAEHQRKIDELVEVTLDMNHLLKSTDIGVIYLDHDLRVRRLTPAIADTFNLLEQDIGRPIEHITARFHQPELFSWIKDVLAGGPACEHEISTSDRAFLLRILPYQLGGETAGVVIALIDITRRKNAEIQLRASETRLSTIVETAVDAIVVVDERGIVQSFNTSAERIFGYAAAEAIGSNVSILMPKALGRAHDDYISAYLRTGVGKVIGTGREVEGRRKDGALVHLDLALTEWSVEGRRYFTGIMRDITGRKEREQHIRLIMRELSHRTKNVLSVVQAMAWQTSRTTSDSEGFQERLSRRIDGLGRSIDLLVRREWEGVDLEELVRDQLSPFFDDAGSHLVLTGPPLTLKPNGAQDLGLVLHELATNASKYGSLSVPTGRVVVGWTVTAAPVALFQMSWREEGGPRIAVPTHAGFGGTVIKDMLAKAHKAVVGMDFPPEGLVWRLELEAHRIVRDVPEPEQRTARP